MKNLLLKFILGFILCGQSVTATEIPAGWQRIGENILQLRLNQKWHLESGEEPDKSLSIPIIVENTEKSVLSHTFFLSDSLKNRELVLNAQIVRPACTIKLNGKFIGNSFPAVNLIDLVLKPELLNFGKENTITFEIDPVLDNRSTLPIRHRPLGLQMTRGILAPVLIKALPKQRLILKNMDYSFSKEWKAVHIKLELAIKMPDQDSEPAAPSRAGEVRVHLRKNGREIVRAQKISVAFDKPPVHLKAVEINAANILTWTPSSPNQYQLEIEFLIDGQLIDKVQRQVGFRDLKIEGRKFILNGNEFQINGIDWFDNLAGQLHEERNLAIQRLVTNVKKLGANILRSVGNQVPADLLRACAAKGIFVLQEMPLEFANATHLRNKKIQSDVEVGLLKLMERDKFNPAVMAWGIGSNFMDFSPAAVPYTESLVKLVHKHDFRPVYLMTRSTRGNTALEKVDFLLLDNFEKENFEYDPALMPAMPILPVLGYFVKPFLVSKDYTQAERRWLEAEEIQADQLANILQDLKQNWPDFTGSFIHALQDWHGEFATVIIGDNTTINNAYPAGLLRVNGESRIAYKMMTALNKGERRPNISPSSIMMENSTIFTLAGVLVVLFILFYLRRDRRLNSKMRRIFIHPHGFYTDLHENRKVPIFITTIIAGAESLVLALLVASSFYACREFLLFDEILNLLFPSPVLKSGLVTLIWNPGWLVFLFAILFIIITFLFALLLRILGFILGKSVSIGQYTTLLFWTATCYLPLALITPVYYRILLGDEGLIIPLGIILFFVVWHLLRVYRGMRVLMVLPPGKSFILFISILIIITGSVAFYYNHTQALFGYIDYYWSYLN